GSSRGRLVLNKASGISGGTVVAVEVAPQHSQHGHLLATVVRCVGNSAGHHPGSRTPHVKEGGFTFEPGLVFGLERRQPPGAEICVTLHEAEPRLRRWQRWRTYLDTKHVAKPQVLADALMHHLLVHAASARVASIRTERKILIMKLTPHAHNFDSFRFIRFYQKTIFHPRHLTEKPGKRASLARLRLQSRLAERKTPIL